MAPESNPSDNSATTSTQVDRAATTSTLAATPNPTTFGQSVTSTVNVTAAAGTVTFFADGTSFASVGVVSSADGLSGTASASISTLGAGPHAITASYGGDASYAPSQAVPVQVTVAANLTTTTLSSDAMTYALGQTLTFVSVISSASGAAPPTGTVTFQIDGVGQPPVTVQGGRAVFTTSSLAAGSHAVSAAYGGDPDLRLAGRADPDFGDRADDRPISTTTTLIAPMTLYTVGQAVTVDALRRHHSGGGRAHRDRHLHDRRRGPAARGHSGR